MQEPNSMPKEEKQQNNHCKQHTVMHMQEREYQKKKGKKTGNEKKQTACDEVKMYGGGISIIPSQSFHAMHYEWLETG